MEVDDRDFRCTLVDGGAAGLRVALRGELDVDGLAEAERALARAVALVDGDLAVDVSGLTFVGAAGLGCLAVAAGELAARGCRLRLVGASPLLVRLLRIVELDRWLVLDGCDGPRRAPGC